VRIIFAHARKWSFFIIYGQSSFLTRMYLNFINKKLVKNIQKLPKIMWGFIQKLSFMFALACTLLSLIYAGKLPE